MGNDVMWGAVEFALANVLESTDQKVESFRRIGEIVSRDYPCSAR